MKYWLIILSLLMVGCNGHLVFGQDRVVYKNFHDKLSCVGLRCCYPYGEQVMVCNQGTPDGDGLFIRYRFK